MQVHGILLCIQPFYIRLLYMLYTHLINEVEC